MKFDQILMLSTFLPETLKSINLAGYWEILDDIGGLNQIFSY